MLLWLLSNHCIVSLVLNVWSQEKNKKICMASLLSSNDCILVHFDNIHLKLSTHIYFEVCFHSILSKYENSKKVSSLMNSMEYEK